MARVADQHRLVPNRHKPLQLMKGTPMLAEVLVVLAKLLLTVNLSVCGVGYKSTEG